MSRRRKILVFLLALLLAAGAWTWLRFAADMRAARAAVAAWETVTVETSFGPVEAVVRGEGIPLLSIHGTGGGFDQGFALAEGLAARGYRVIAPSRFGYLGAPVPERTDATAQADAFAELLDGLGVDRAVVMGASAGAITALNFAARHPDRTLALLPMVPAYFPPENAAPAPWSPVTEWAITSALQSDFLFWAGLELFPLAMSSAVLATDRALIEGADPAERARLDAVMAMILPISARAPGLLLDAKNTAAPAVADLSAITAPTFIASAEDDRYETAKSARLLARGIPSAELLITPDGGHVWAGRNAEVQAAVAGFLDRALAR